MGIAILVALLASLLFATATLLDRRDATDPNQEAAPPGAVAR